MKIMTKKYLKRRIKDLEKALRKISIAADYEISDTAICAKREIRKYTINYSDFTVTNNGKVKATFQEVK